MILASSMTVISCLTFALAQSFDLLQLAQVLMAAGIAFQSGSDSALLYDSLCAMSREQEYTERETIAQKWSMTALAIPALQEVHWVSSIYALPTSSLSRRVTQVLCRYTDPM